MSRRSTWIERGPDGRPYFVRKKSDTPSAKELFSLELLRQSARSFFSSRDSRQNHHVQCVTTTDGPLALPAPTSPDHPAPSGPHPAPPMAPTSQAQPQPVTMYLLPPQHGQNQTNSRDKGNGQEHAINPPAQFIPAPLPPGIFPIGPFPPHPMGPQPPTLFPPPVPFAPPPQSFLANPPGGSPCIPTNTVSAQTQQYGPQVPFQGPIAAQGDARYKCEICGRYRSARYHYKHPIQPGQLPGKTICRKCREQATDSEDGDSSDGVQSPRLRRHQSRALPRRSSSMYKSQRHRSRSRARSRGRAKLIDYDDRSCRAPSYSESTSSSLEEESSGSGRGRYRRGKTADRELFRHTRRLHLSPLGERTFYDGDSEGRRRNYEDNLKGGEYEEATARRPRSRLRQPTPGPRILRRQYSDPFVGIPAIEDHAGSRQHFNWGAAHTRPRERYSPQRGPTSFRSGYESGPVHHATHHSQGVDDSENDHESDHHRHVRLRSRSAQRGSHHRRHMIHEYDDESQEEDDHRGLHAPSPPPLRSSSLGYMGEPELGEEGGRHSRARRGRRRRSRSRSQEDEQSGSRILRPGDEVTVIERHEPKAREDYDWYDDGGMRVRVREISR
ncbi:uncharacterized protein Z520_05375 [Fonsecaea multimorphosa CBS 102226]|uniref:Uncharacterized protein n=1 Tax=Fonsecaea multimorphosa CBS 102226 TaxID=1442371 RepID=A0A0D2K727_9EURO|nr:uncharacterized protein Z520_05375 [Fonsecaea multimorphosa CBS 102226]KIX98914.1 hypothetical protein Z520_05375 [Fonsecaea multimorphosa CBS 102226]